MVENEIDYFPTTYDKYKYKNIMVFFTFYLFK